MENNESGLRKTVLLDRELVSKCETMYGEANVTSFTQFVKQALELYIDYLISGNHGALLSKGIQDMIHSELSIINHRLSKSLYRYAIELDMLCQMLASVVEEEPSYYLEQIRKEANARVAMMRGKVCLEEITEDIKKKESDKNLYRRLRRLREEVRELEDRLGLTSSAKKDSDDPYDPGYPDDDAITAELYRRGIL